eukprot:GILK01026223.1.p1 GENE.GILK01026223.1~~GILK01026223.1.p1  ORF type:complete len:326 (-),score=60.62 GILK01026223.1:9-962(-)
MEVASQRIAAALARIIVTVGDAKIDKREEAAQLAADISRMRSVINKVVDYSDAKKRSSTTASSGRTPARLASKHIADIESQVAAASSTANLWSAMVAKEVFTEGDEGRWAVEDLAGTPPSFTTSVVHGSYAEHVAKQAQVVVTQNESLTLAQAKTEAAITEASAQSASATEKINAAFEQEMKSLQVMVKKFKQIESEQQFHVRRGTFVKEKSGLDHKAMAKEKEGKIHSDLCAEAYEKEKRKDIIENEIFGLKKDIDALNKDSGISQSELKVNIATVSEKLSETEEDKSLLEQEREDLLGLKRELTTTIQRVRATRK